MRYWPWLLVLLGILLVFGGYTLSYPKEQVFHPLHWELLKALRKTGLADIQIQFIGFGCIIFGLGFAFRNAGVGD